MPARPGWPWEMLVTPWNQTAPAHARHWLNSLRSKLPTETGQGRTGASREASRLTPPMFSGVRAQDREELQGYWAPRWKQLQGSTR